MNRMVYIRWCGARGCRFRREDTPLPAADELIRLHEDLPELVADEKAGVKM